MPIIGMNFTSISAKLYPDKKVEENINVNSSPTIEKVEKRELGLQSMKEALAIKFRFETDYTPKIGEISLHGEVLYTSDRQKSIMDKWEKDKKLDDAVAVEVMNAIFRKCLIEAINLSAELRLPPPMRFPVVKPKEENEYTG